MLVGSKRIAIVTPIVSNKNNASITKYLNGYLSAGFKLNIINIQYGGRESIGGRAVAVALPYIIQEMVNAAEKGFDAVISNCFGDPGVNEARALVKVPVIGPGESALHLACMLGHRVGLVELCGTRVTQLHGKGSNWAHQIIKRNNLEQSVVSVKSIALDMEDFLKGNLVQEVLYKASLKAIEVDGAEVIVLACTGLMGYAEELQRKLGVPVIEPLIIALKMAELQIAANLSHSKLAYPSDAERGVRVKIKFPPTLKTYPR